MNIGSNFNRREFLKTSGLLAAGVLASQTPVSAASSDTLGAVLPKRRLGKTGLDVTLFCVGGAHIGTGEEASAQARLETALEEGCRFFETAQGYQKGRSEERFGKYLVSKYREQITLMTKTTATDGDTVMKHIDESLSRLRTDYLDIYLMRWIKTPEDAQTRLDNGVYDAMLKLKEQGKIKHIGFSGHSSPEANNYLIGKGLSELEVVLMPVNVVDRGYYSFIDETIPKVVDNDLGLIAMKTFAGKSLFGGKAPWGRNKGDIREAVVPNLVSVRQAHHFVYSLPVAAITSGAVTVDQMKENIGNARDFAGMTQAERDEIFERVKTLAVKGDIEHYKHA